MDIETQSQIKNGKLATKIVSGGLIGAVIIIGSLLATRPLIVAALSVPEQVEVLRESVTAIRKDVRELETRREQERLLLQALQTDMGHVLRKLDTIERQQTPQP